VTQEQSCDIAVLGGGPVGCTVALALAAAGRSVYLLERRSADAEPVPGLAMRPLALSHGTRQILERLGAWPGPSATPIRRIHASRAGGFGETKLDADDAGVPALGYVVSYADLLAVLQARIENSAVVVLRGSAAQTERDADGRHRIRTSTAWLAPGCIVHAEGSSDDVPGKRYPHEALSAVVTPSQPATDLAFERFRSDGPLALLPMRGRYALVWSLPPSEAARLQVATDAEFLAVLNSATGGLPGRLLGTTLRQRISLTQRVRSAVVDGREVYIGNAAQTLHPVAGQGLNLGLRDAWELAALIGDAPDPGAPPLLRHYAAQRRTDAVSSAIVTDLLASHLSGRGPLAGLALGALDLVPGARRFFTRRMIFGTRALP